MSARQPKYSMAEHARRGTEIYERRVRSQVDPGRTGEVVAIDIDSGEFEVAPDSLAAAQRLLSRVPDAQIWCVRVGYPAVHRIGVERQ